MEGQESKQPLEQPARTPRDAIAAGTDTAHREFVSSQKAVSTPFPWDLERFLHTPGSCKYQHHFSSPSPALHHLPRRVLLAGVSLVFPDRYYSLR